ncbi:MAG: PAS domain S-box protein [Candidatus Zixiibacteriota bacterium]
MSKGNGDLKSKGNLKLNNDVIHDLKPCREIIETLPDYFFDQRNLKLEKPAAGMVLHDAEGFVISANPSAEVLLGVPLAQLKGRSVFDERWRTIDRNRIPFAPNENPLQLALKKGEGFQNRVLGIYKPGTDECTWINLSLIPFLHISRNRPVYFTMIIENITEKVNREWTLQENERLYREIIEYCGEGVAIIKDGLLQFVNPQTMKITGYLERDLLQQPFLKFIYPDDREDLNRRYLETVQNRRYYPAIQFRIINAEDKVIWCECNSVYIEWRGEPASLNFFRNITVRKRAEAELKESEARYRSFIENYHGIAFRGDLLYNPQYISGAVEKITGYKPEAFMSNEINWRQIVLPRDYSDMERDENLLVSRPGFAVSRNYRIVRKDGEIRCINEHVKNVCGSDGKPERLESFIEDVTEIRKVRELESRIQFEHLITKISTDFINIDLTRIDQEVTKALGVIGDFAEADRGYVFLFDDDRKTVSNTHEWCREGISAQIKKLQKLAVSDFPWWRQILQNRENIILSDIDDLPTLAANEKKLLWHLDILSLAVVPLFNGETLIGFLGFDAVRKNRHWSEDTVAILKIAGMIIVNALERKKTDERLKQIHDELERRVYERTRELYDANRELEAERETLNRKNLALKEVLSQIEDEKKQIARQVQSNIDRIVLPIVDILARKIPEDEYHHLNLLKNCLSDLCSPFLNRLEAKFNRLTPRELEICKMIKNGFSTKQISKSLNNSVQTVLKQRKTIRKKLKIANKKINMASYLKSLR